MLRRRESNTHGRHVVRPSGCVLAALMMLVPMLCAMRCTNGDLTHPFTISLTQNGQSEQMQIVLPYTGRLSLDVGIDAQQDGEIKLRIQAQTSGNPDEDGCNDISSGDLRTIDAAPWNGNDAPTDPEVAYPAIGNLTLRTRVTLAYDELLGAYAGTVELATNDTRVRIYTTSNDVSLWDLRGNIVPPIAPTHPATCTGVYVTVYEMPDEHTRISFRSRYQRVLLTGVEGCAANHIVDRVCPGAHGQTHEDTLQVLAGQHRVQRYSSLGVGDTLLIEATCKNACPATVQLFGWIEPLDCQTDAGCPTKRSCTSEGYCLRNPPPKCAVGGAQTPGAWLTALILLLLLPLRRRRRAH